MSENTTNSTIVEIIIIVLSLVIIFIFISYLDLGGDTKKEICHNSVVLSSTTAGIGHLNCEVYKLCISGGDDCTGDFDKEIKVDLTKKNKEFTDQVWKIIADEMADCWSVYGEGKIDYTGLKETKTQAIENWILETEAYSCGVCSTIKFSEKVARELNVQFSAGQIGIRNYYLDDSKGLYQYLSDNYYATNKKYSIFLYGTTGVDNIKNLMWREGIGGFTLVGGINPSSTFLENFLILTGMSAKIHLPTQFIEENRLKEALVTRDPSEIEHAKQFYLEKIKKGIESVLPDVLANGINSNLPNWDKNTLTLPVCRGGFISRG